MLEIKQTTRGFLLAAGGTALFSCKGILIKLCYQYGADANTVIVLRMIFALPFYLTIAFLAYPSAKQALNLKTWAAIAVLGTLGYFLASILDLHGLYYISASLERIILFTYPVMVLALSVLFLKYSLNKNMLFCVGLVYLGLCTVFLNQPTHSQLDISQENIPLGSLLVFSAAFAFSIYMIGAEVLLKTIPNRFYTSIAMLAASVAIFIYVGFIQTSSLVSIELLLQQPIEIYGLTILIAFFCTVLPSFMVTAAIGYIGAAKAGTVGSIGPLVTLALATVILEETLAPLQLAGFVCVMGGVYWLGKQKTSA